MKVKVTKFKPLQFPENEVKKATTTLPYKTQNVKFDPEGLFSEVIFGRIGRCNCGQLNEAGYCEKCDTRVVDINNMPDFWFDLGVDILTYNPLWNQIEVDRDRLKQIKSVLAYTHFVYLDVFKNSDTGEDDFDLSIEKMPETMEEFNSKLFDDEQVYIGKEAAEILGATPEWLENNMSSALYVPHPIYRPLIKQEDGTPYISELNEKYIEIINRSNNVKELQKFASSKIYNLVSYRKLNEVYQEIVEKMMDQLQESRHSVLRSEVISHPMSGAIRGTVLNRHDINEDVLLIGDSFVKTLWPYLYQKHNGNIVKINQELIDENYNVILNRPPSISYMSIMGFKPRINSLYPYGHIEGTNGGLLQNTDYINSKAFAEQGQFVSGDLESYSAKMDSRSNYDNVPKQIYRKWRFFKHDVSQVFGPIEREDTVLQDQLRNPGKFNVYAQNKEISSYEMGDLEHIMYDMAWSTEDSLFKIQEIMNMLEIMKINGVNDKKFDGLKEIPLEFVLMSVQDLNSDTPMQDKKFESNKENIYYSIAKALFESDEFNYKRLELKKKSPSSAFGLRKRIYDKILMSSNTYYITMILLHEKINKFLGSYLRTKEHDVDFEFMSMEKLVEFYTVSYDYTQIGQYLYDKTPNEIIDNNTEDQNTELLNFYKEVANDSLRYSNEVLYRIKSEAKIIKDNMIGYDEDTEENYKKDWFEINDETVVYTLGDDGVGNETGRTIAFNPIVEDGLAADTDGDVLFVSAIYGRDATNEVETILSSHRFIDYAQGKIRNGIVEDFFIGQ